MRRKTTVAVVGAVAGSALLVGARFAVPSLASTHVPGHHAKTAFQPGVACTSDDHGKPGTTGPRRGNGERDNDSREGREGDEGAARSGRDDRCHPRSKPPSTEHPSPSSTVTVRPPTPAPTRTTTSPAPPSPSATSTLPACMTTAGNAVNVASPGVGALTVTIKVCGGVMSTSNGSLSQSNLPANTPAIPALNTLAVQYYKTNISMIHYSGATLTSNAYQASLQSAMAKAGI